MKTLELLSKLIKVLLDFKIFLIIILFNYSSVAYAITIAGDLQFVIRISFSIHF